MNRDRAERIVNYKEAARREPSFFIEDMQADRPDDAVRLAVNIMRVAMSAIYSRPGYAKERLETIRTLVEYELHRQAELVCVESTLGEESQDGH